MRQVPYYLIIGNGRLAKHFAHYLNHLALAYSCWSRSTHLLSDLDLLLKNVTHVLILISDNAIDPFIESHILNQYPGILCLHFSGCLTSKYAYSAHPLQTFSNTLYSIETYKKIPFILDEISPDIQTLLPGIPNPHYRISAYEKPYYHALCVMANNFTSLLWKKFFYEMDKRFSISSEHLQPFLHQTFNNIIADPSTALTGPIQRGDLKTLDNNLKALEKDEFYTVFKAFVEQFAFRRNDEKRT